MHKMRDQNAHKKENTLSYPFLLLSSTNKAVLKNEVTTHLQQINICSRKEFIIVFLHAKKRIFFFTTGKILEKTFSYVCMIRDYENEWIGKFYLFLSFV